ncbi:hypothetical protein SBOR_6613 [Sclerotinia borealis F-4128]|uniref:Large ribosomal subunit protein mL67 n=1 Tax=Sclerotinia borealis (strain F-4128) TaxID=1432307 RepID=W9C8B5_SCLBF|nr:hypothetical protein SBOR_6613 [Sclerotinia borealis F-4128]
MSVPSLRNCIGNSVSRTAGVRYASTLSVTARQPVDRPQHGEQIYVYNHLQTNQVVYSLTKGMDNTASLAQLPYNGKKTRPAALRKDHWHPMALITFPSGASNSGLSAFQKLREYRKRHELSWDPHSPLFKRIPSPGETDLQKTRILLPAKQRGRKINDQKANTVADMAAVLREIRYGSERIGLTGIGKEGVVEVKWSDLADASYAGSGTEIWGEAVLHDTLPWDRNNRDIRKKQALSTEQQAEWKAARAAHKAANEEKKRLNREEIERNMILREQRWAKHVALMESHVALGKGPKTIPQRIRQSPAENWALERQARLEKLAWMERTGSSELEYEFSLTQTDAVNALEPLVSELETGAGAEAGAKYEAGAEPLGLDVKPKTPAP